MLKSRNIADGKLRTSIRLNERMWRVAQEICLREELSLSEWVQKVRENHPGTKRTEAVRVEIVDYLYAAATEDGHMRAGHGRLPEDGPVLPQIVAENDYLEEMQDRAA